MADQVLRYKFRPHADLMTTVGLAWAAGNDFDATADTNVMRALMKSCASIARYMRQPMSWVESLSLDELNRWGDVLGEILLEERGVGVDREGVSDPFNLLRTDD